MSLFVGNVSKHVSHRQLQNLFKKYGKCRIDLRDRYAFVQFDNDNHAEQAKKELQLEAFHGKQLNIEWSKNSGRFGQNNRRKDGNGNGNGKGQRKRSRSRQNRWRRDDRWNRRSPSNERRSSPSYSGNKDFQDFQPVCPRDKIIKQKLLSKVKQRERRHHETQKSKTRQPRQLVSPAKLNNNENENNMNHNNTNINIKEEKQEHVPLSENVIKQQQQHVADNNIDNDNTNNIPILNNIADHNPNPDNTAQEDGEIPIKQQQ